MSIASGGWWATPTLQQPETNTAMNANRARAITFALAGILLSSTLSAPAQQLEPLAMSYVQANSAYWDIAVAWDRGLFAREGFSPSYATNTGSVQSTQLLITQSVQMAIAQPEVLIAAMSRGTRDIGAFAAPMDRPDWLLVAQRAITTVPELKGKVIGFSGLRVGEFWLTREVLKQNGLGPKDVDAIQVGTSPAKFAALEKGSIAATLLFQPTAAQAVAAGFNSLYDFSEKTGFTPLLYMVNRKWAADKQHGQRISRAIRSAHDWLNDPANRAEAISILAKTTKREPKLLDGIYEQYFAHKAYAADAAIDAKSLESWIKLMVDNGELNAASAPGINDILLPPELGGLRK
jgi:ABC-type nitrate/sulfonate/bicarbonate transport system substrate-binding protein